MQRCKQFAAACGPSIVLTATAAFLAVAVITTVSSSVATRRARRELA